MALLLLVPPLLAARPGRLRPWAAVAALAIELLPLWFSLSLIASHNGWGLILFALFAYVPAVIVVRLVAQGQRRLAAREATLGAVTGAFMEHAPEFKYEVQHLFL